MSQFKNNPNYNLYYTDTDSIFVDGPIDNKLVGSELGKMKLEYKFKDAIFLGPKIYSGVKEDGTVLTKIKGFKKAKELTFDELETLLHKNNKLNLTHEKWFRSASDESITIKESLYTLAATHNKREFIYDSDRKAKLIQAKSD